MSVRNRPSRSVRIRILLHYYRPAARVYFVAIDKAGDVFLKKPFVSIKSRSDTAKLVLFFLLSTSALVLLFLPEESSAVFGDGSVSEGAKGIMSLVERLL